MWSCEALAERCCDGCVGSNPGHLSGTSHTSLTHANHPQGKKTPQSEDEYGTTHEPGSDANAIHSEFSYLLFIFVIAVIVPQKIKIH